jgi:hypothetical protein
LEMTRKRAATPKTKAAAKSNAPEMPFKPVTKLPVRAYADLTPQENAREVAKQILSPEMSAGRVIYAAENRSRTGENLDGAGMLAELRATQKAVNAGDLTTAEAMLIAQATALQSLSVNLIERATSQQWMPQFETYIRLGLKAQAQSRHAIETLATLKHGPAVLARTMQMNVAHGAQQVNNSPAPPPVPGLPVTIPHAEADFEIPPSKLLSANGENVDDAAAQCPSGGNPSVAPLGEILRSQDGRGKMPGRAESR